MGRTLAGGLGAVVAAEARPGDAAVVEGSGNPSAGLVAILASVVGGEMGRTLAGGLGAVVAAEAGAGHI